MVYLPLIIIVLAIVTRIVYYYSACSAQGETTFDGDEQRFLDAPESLTDELQLLNGISNICLTFSILSKTSLPLKSAVTALRMVVKRQPLLRATIVKKMDSKKYFKLIKGKELEATLCTSDVKATDWHGTWQNIVCSPFRSREPLWRAMILKEEYNEKAETYLNTFNFVFHHAVADGVAVSQVAMQFVHYLNAVATGQAQSVEDIQSLPLMPNASTLTSHIGSWSRWQEVLGLPQLWKILLKCVVTLMMKRRTTINRYFLRHPPRSHSSDQARAKIIHRQLSIEETRRLVTACKAKGCSVTGAFVVASHMVFKKLCEDSSQKGYPKLEAAVGVNVRPDTEPRPSPSYVGTYATGFTLALSDGGEAFDFWTLAKRVTDEMRNTINQKNHIKLCLQIIGTLGYEAYMKFLCPEDENTLLRIAVPNAISNIGRIEGEKEGSGIYEIEKLFFSSACHRMPQIFSHYMVTFNDNLICNTCYDDLLVQDDDAQMFVNQMHAIIGQYTKDV